MLRAKYPSFDRQSWSGYLVGGLITFATPFFCLAWAQGQLTGSVTAIINAMTPIMVVIVSHFYPGGERATWPKAGGVAIGFVSVALLVIPNMQQGFGGPLAARPVVLIGPFFYALAGNYSRRFAGSDPALTVTGTMTGAAICTLPLALLLEGPPGPMPGSSVAAFLAIGLISTGLAFRIMYRLLPRIGATNFSIVTSWCRSLRSVLERCFSENGWGRSTFLGWRSSFVG